MAIYNTPKDQDLSLGAEQAISHYNAAHERLYRRPPRDIRALNAEWVIVNGARMRASELEYLTRQLVLEYDQSVAQRKGLVLKLLNFFRAS